jgi:hypothetical protein
MNLTDEQAIYKWLKPEGAQLKQCDYPQRGTWVYQWEPNRISDGGPYACPPLDMNTAFSECIPKLKAEFRSVKWDGETWTIYVPQCYGEPVSWKNTDFYAALLQYLGVK